MSKRLRSSEVCADCSGPGELHRPGPLPSALLTRTTAPGPTPWVLRFRRPSSALHARGRDEEEPRRPWDGSRLGPVRRRRGGGRRPLVPLFPLVLSVPGRAGRRRVRGRGCYFNRMGLGQSTGKPITEAQCERPPARGPQRLQVSPFSLPHPPPPRAPLHEGALPGVSDIRHFPPPKRAKGPVNDFSAPDIWAPAPPRIISRMSVSCERNQHLRGNAYVKFWDLKGLSSN